MVAALMIGLVWFHGSGRLWFCAAMLVVIEWMSLGASAWPWRLFDRLPLVANVVPDRFAGVADLFAAVMLGVIVDRGPRVRVAVARTPTRRPTARRYRGGGGAGGPRPRAHRRPVPTAPHHPQRGRAAVVRHGGYPGPAHRCRPHLPVRVLGTAGPHDLAGDNRPALVPGRWRQHHPGPDRPIRAAPNARSAQADQDLVNLSDGYLPLPTGSAAESARLRLALHDWGVTTVVIPSETGWPTSLRGRSVPVAIAYMTAALGTGPIRQADAWVWSVPRRPEPARSVSPADFARCTTSTAAEVDPGAAASCVLRAST